MCGIAGIVNFSGFDFETYRDNMAAALVGIARRGPDGSGIWHNDMCLLGHTRLAIIDLTPSASQPMTGFGSTITFNGEIYNYKILRHELQLKGYQFRTQSDTEILLAAWREWGQDMLPKLHGMFAFGLFDNEMHIFFMARDRFGKKPLLYYRKGPLLFFSSTLVGVESLLGEVLDLDPTALRLYFSLRYVPDPWSIASGVLKIPRGHCAKMDANGCFNIRQWFQPSFTTDKRFVDIAEGIDLLRTKFDKAVKDRLIADVPVGTFLSGGVDSSIVTASIMQQIGSMKSFSIGFDEDARIYDESAQAKRVAQYLGTEHHEFRIRGKDIVGSFDDFISCLDEPFADPSALPTYILSAQVRNFVTVVLSGDGADELFGGYRKYVAEYYAQLYRFVPSGLRNLVRFCVRGLPESKTDRITEYFRQLRRFVLHADKPNWLRFAAWIELLNKQEITGLFSKLNEFPTIADLLEINSENQMIHDSVNLMSFSDLTFGLPNQMLVKVDRMSMAHGLEVRCPFLDLDVVQIASSIPAKWKVHRSERKRILREAFGDRLPKSVFQGSKKGFDPPLEKWLTDSFADRLALSIDPGHLNKQGLFNSDVPGNWLRDLQNGKRDTAAHLWTFLIFQYWYGQRYCP